MQMERIQNKVAWSMVCALSIIVIAALAGVAQGGPLDPPAAPSETGRKQLFQPSGGCAGFPIQINGSPGMGSGSYVFSQDITIPGGCGDNGIEITVSDVEIDLNGFTLRGAAGSLTGITDLSSSPQRVTIRNGTVTGWGSDGVFLPSTTQTEVAGVTASSNAGYGIYVSGGSVSDCQVRSNGSVGLIAYSSSVANCTADDNGADGFLLSGSSLSGCKAQSNSAYGIQAYNSTITDCEANGNLGFSGVAASYSTLSAISADYNEEIGINIFASSLSECQATGNGIVGPGTGGIVAFSGTVSGCTANYNTGIGIDAENTELSDVTANGNSTSGIDVVNSTLDGCTANFNGTSGITTGGIGGGNSSITGCTANSNSASGIFAFVGNTILENETVGNAVFGIDVAGAGNVIDSNTANGNTGGQFCVCVAGNTVIRNRASGAAPYAIAVGNTYVLAPLGPGLIPAGANPWANIIY
jgi:hypothetical protein